MENRPVPLLWIALPVFLIFLGANSIWDANEAFYVETPRQMVLTGDYVTPMFNGAERLNKPVLSYWIVAGLYHLFGISVGVERIAIAIAGLAIVLVGVPDWPRPALAAPRVSGRRSSSPRRHVSCSFRAGSSSTSA